MFKDIIIVYAAPEDHIGNNIWGIYSTYKKAKKALKKCGLKRWDPYKHNADDPENEIPRFPNERVIGFMALDYKPKGGKCG